MRKGFCTAAWVTGFDRATPRLWLATAAGSADHRLEAQCARPGLTGYALLALSKSDAWN